MVAYAELFVRLPPRDPELPAHRRRHPEIGGRFAHGVGVNLPLDLRRKIQPAERRRLDGWHEYERRKERWNREHPEATHKEREQAMRAIAQELGI